MKVRQVAIETINHSPEDASMEQIAEELQIILREPRKQAGESLAM